MNDADAEKQFANEATGLIYAWIRDEFPRLKLGVGTDHNSRAFSSTKDGTTDIILANIDKAGIVIYIRNLEIAIHITTPKTRGRIREVRLTDPNSITSLQEVIKHVVNVTLSPWWPDESR